MHMMVVDESGAPGYPANGNWTGWSGSRYFVRVEAPNIVHTNTLTENLADI